jgi:hypothetical protein
VDPRTDPGREALVAARDEVVAARAALGEETVRLQAAARAAVDIKAKVKRSPMKAASLAGSAAFVAVGGPRRVLRGVRHRIFGTPQPLPPSLLPDQVERAVRALGDDGAKVRGALEREFAGFLASTAKGRKTEARSRSLARLAVKVATPLAARAAREAIDRAVRPSVAAARGGAPKGTGE